MSSVIDRPSASVLNSGARAYARLDARVAQGRQPGDLLAQGGAPVEPQPPRPEVGETVTMSKIGEFLELDLRRLFVWLRAGFFLTLLLALLGAGAGAAFAILSKPKFTVSTEILIDPSNLQVMADDLFAAPGQVDTQVMTAGSKLRILTSGNVLARVVDELDLANDPEFVEPAGGSLFGGGTSESPNADPKVVALASLTKRVSTRADEKSFVVTLSVSSESSDKSIRIADAIVKAFQQELANAEAAGASRTAEALDSRLTELKAGVKLAEDKVETYRRENGLASSAGELVSTQTMTQLNTQLLDAQTRVIAAQSTYDSLLAGGANASTADTQASVTLGALRTRYTDLKQQFDSQSRIYGPRHPTIVRLSSELEAVRGDLDAELKRIVRSAKASLDEANASVAALTDRAEALRANVFTDNQAQVTLRELERDAASKSTIYEAFLARARQITEREQIDTTNIRVISTAVPPAARSYPPRTVVVMAIGAAAGAVLGMLLSITLGIFRDMRRDRRDPMGPAAA